MSVKCYNTTPEMVELLKDEWPFMPGWETVPLRVWISNKFLAVLYEQRADGKRRLAVNQTRRNGKTWRDGITWDELQRVKNECLGPETWCVEVYPAESELVNVSNMRHLWVLNEPPETRFPKEAVTSDDDIAMALRMAKAVKR